MASTNVLGGIGMATFSSSKRTFNGRVSSMPRSVFFRTRNGNPPAPRGVPQIVVKFDIDANGILSACATDRATGNKQEITITGSSTLPEEERKYIVKEAEKFAKGDKEKREAIDTKNQADSVVYQTEKQLKEIGEKISGKVKEKVEAKLRELKNKIGSGTTQETKGSMAAVDQEVMQIGLSMYKFNQPGGESALN